MNKNIGRGLSTFLDVPKHGAEVLKISVDKVSPNPHQPRKIFDEEAMRFLSESIKHKGVLQPILVNKISEDMYQLVAGERRWRASRLAGLKEIPAIEVSLDEKDQFEVAILENIQREDLNPMEEAEAYKNLMNRFGYTQEHLSNIVGKSRSHIANILRLLTLSPHIQDMIKNKQLSFGHARALIGVENADELADSISAESLSVRNLEKMIKQRKRIYSPRTPKMIDPEIYNMIHHLSELTGIKSNIKLNESGGIVEFHFSTLYELDNFISKLNKVYENN